MLFICSFCVSLREVIYWCFLFVIFFMKSKFFFDFVLEFIFEMKVLQEDLLASLMMCRVFALWLLVFV